MRILYISQYFPPEVGATQTRAYEMASNLVRMGHRVTVLTEVPNHPQGIIQKAYRKKLIVREELDGIDVLRVWVKTSPNKTFVTRMAFYLSFALMAILVGLLLRRRHHVVYATSPPLFVGPSGILIAVFRRMRFVFEVRDLWPESALALNELSNPWAIRFLETLVSLCYSRAHRIVAVTQGIYKSLRQKGLPPRKLVLIPNGANVHLYRPLQKDEELQQTLGLSGRFVVLYAGLHGLIHGMESIIQAANLLRKFPKIVFLLIGDGVKKASLMKAASEIDLQNVIFLESQVEEELPRYISLADVGLATTKKLLLCRGTLPVKMLSYMACGRPVILAADGEARNVLKEARAGLCVEPENAHQIARAILKLSRNPKLAQQMGHRGREFVVLHYSRRSQAEMLERVLEAAIK